MIAEIRGIPEDQVEQEVKKQLERVTLILCSLE